MNPDEQSQVDAGKTDKVVALMERYFTKAGDQVSETVEWGEVEASITEPDGTVIFSKKVLAPKSWSQTAVNIAAYKYLRKGGIGNGLNQGETNIWQMISRVTDALGNAGKALGHLQNDEEVEIFRDEISYILLHQRAAFNSPVWFNCGLYEKYGVTTSTRNYFWNPITAQIEITDAYIHPQCSACFIQSIGDSMEDILDLVKKEGTIFKLGSGTGTNYSSLRSRFEKLSSGGTSSGMMSFLKIFDTNAGAIKSGGTTRRAAKMDIVDIDHPEVVDFIWWKAKEERKAKVLIEYGNLPADFNGEAYQTVGGQHSNNSVRVTDEFMQAYLNDGEWQTKFRTNGEIHQTYQARDLMRQIAEAAWECADPGLQYDTTINRWHTCKNSGRIIASNPCSEYMFLDDSACNLSSINLLQYLGDDGVFDIQGFVHTVKMLILAQEIMIDYASYPSSDIAYNSHLYRPLGLGFANLGALLMVLGLPYDSDKGRDIAAAITAILTGQAYVMSAQIAGRLGAFEKYPENSEPMLSVIGMHRESAYKINKEFAPKDLWNWATRSWDDAYDLGKRFGYRNAQVTVLAPTGTIAFLMDCDTTGIEPDYALIKWKKLAGGGGYQIVNRAVGIALKRLGYSKEQIEEIEQHILDTGSIEGAPHIEEKHLSVFDCASAAGNGKRFISPMGHLRMMAATQPFLSGAISKTVNLAEEATVEEIEEIYVQAWRMGIKALALYRNNSKSSQPLSAGKEKSESQAEEVVPTKPNRYLVRELPQTRKGLTHKVTIGGHTIYLTANLYDDGDVGEIFIQTAKEGSTMAGLLDTLARMMSKMLQRDVPLDVIISSLLHMRFEPSGATNNPDIIFTQSISDYIGKWLGYNFLPRERWSYIGLVAPAGFGDPIEMNDNGNGKVNESAPIDEPIVDNQQSLPIADVEPMSGESEKVGAPSCAHCGGLMIRNGSCWVCPQCGGTTGCS